MLEKVDPNDIELNYRRAFYRATPQGFLERNIFLVSKQYDRPCYLAANGVEETHITPDFLKALTYARDWCVPLEHREIPPIFTNYMAILEINAEPYLDRIYQSPTMEGIVIKNPIELQDIKLIWSADNTQLDAKNLPYLALPGAIENGNAYRIFGLAKDDLLQAAGEPPHNTFIRRYLNDKEKLNEDLYAYFRNLPKDSYPAPSREDIAKLLPRIVSISIPHPL